MANGLNFNIPGPMAISAAEFIDTPTGPIIWLTVTGSSKAGYVAIPIVAVKNRRNIHAIAACQRRPGGADYCSDGALCPTCNQAAQVCIQEHIDAGRL